MLNLPTGTELGNKWYYYFDKCWTQIIKWSEAKYVKYVKQNGIKQETLKLSI